MNKKSLYWGLLVWLMVAVLAMLPFWIPQWQLDFRVTQFFYHPTCSPTGWVLDCHPLFRTLFYSAVPIVSYLIGFLAIGLIFWRPKTLKAKQARLRGFYFVLVFVLGSGLVVNAVFKENWGRPRPVQTQDFGGSQVYVPPGKLNLAGEGKSFSSGHSSVGFAFLALWFMWRREKPNWAIGGLATGLLLGYATGLARIAVGAHYLSDVLWSGLMMAMVAWLVYYPLLNMPRRELALRESTPS